MPERGTSRAPEIAMDWVWFLFGLKGRITRAGLWLALLVILCWMSLVAALIAGGSKLLGGPASFHFDVNDIFAALDPETYRLMARAGFGPAIIYGIGTPLFAWVFVATCIKRLHDRGKSSWWMLPFFVIPGLVDQFAGRLGETSELVVGTVVVLLYFWGFIELYCLAGEPGANRFGPDPLAGVQARERRARAAARPAWDQHSELELMPQIGSPPLTAASICDTSPVTK
jgi:uncharacterized membrane protein YhaH (DUF805 family)